MDPSSASPEKPTPPPSGDVNYQAGPPRDPLLVTVLRLLVGTIAGFVVFVLAGFFVLRAFNNEAALVIYLLLAVVAAFGLSMRAWSRGLGIGIFLGLGAVGLVFAACSGMSF